MLNIFSYTFRVKSLWQWLYMYNTVQRYNLHRRYQENHGLQQWNALHRPMFWTHIMKECAIGKLALLIWCRMRPSLGES